MSFQHEPWRIPLHVDHHGRLDCPPACSVPEAPWGTPTALARPGECGNADPHAPHPYGADVLGQNSCAGVEPHACHCGAPVAAVADPAEYAALGPAPYGLCVRCLPLRCDVHPGACEPDAARIARRAAAIAPLSESDYRRAVREAEARRERRRRITSVLGEVAYYAAWLFLLLLPVTGFDYTAPMREQGIPGLLAPLGVMAAIGVLLWHAPRNNRP